MPAIKQTAELLHDISTSSIEQLAGANQIDSSVLTLNAAALKTASSAESIAAATGDLSSEVDQLQGMIEHLHLLNDWNVGATARHSPQRLVRA